jgi:hypothetical protein
LTLPPGIQAFRIVLYSDPILLAEGGPASEAAFAIPADIPAGSHTLVLWTLVDGVLQVSGTSFDVQGDPTTNLPTTGSRRCCWWVSGCRFSSWHAAAPTRASRDRGGTQDAGCRHCRSPRVVRDLHPPC